MNSLKVLSTAAAMALVLPMMAPTASFAQTPNGKVSASPRGVGGGAPAARMGGGGFRAGGGGGAPVARFSGGGGSAPATSFSGTSGGYRGGYSGGYRRGGGGFIPGAVAGAVVGGAIASSYGYYGGPGYYAPGYYDDQYYDDSVVAAPAGDDAVAYCMQTYQSYDPASGTYLGYDGLRHPCP